MNLATAFRVVLDTLLPPNCLACDTPVAADGQFCVACFRQANFISAPFCGGCGVPLPFQDGAGHCTACAHTRPAFNQARAALRYDETAKKLILPFKYADRPEAARGLAVMMARAGAGLLGQADMLMPVPLHKARLRRRGYNQAVLLARELGRRAALPVLRDTLFRCRATLPLGGMGVEARAAELADAIALRPDAAARLPGKNLLLIDDVMTTGATANACAVVLLAAGAAAVNVLTVARVADPRFS